MIDQSEPGQNTLVNFFERSSFFMILLLLLILSGAIYVVVAPHPAGTMELQEGQISPYTLYADFDFQTEDQKKSEEKSNDRIQIKIFMHDSHPFF